MNHEHLLSRSSFLLFNLEIFSSSPSKVSCSMQQLKCSVQTEWFPAWNERYWRNAVTILGTYRLTRYYSGQYATYRTAVHSISLSNKNQDLANIFYCARIPQKSLIEFLARLNFKWVRENVQFTAIFKCVLTWMTIVLCTGWPILVDVILYFTPLILPGKHSMS